ncbi:DUF7572 family protein [Rhodococcus opacus]|uniref:DUF7572 family protein n=1 Tax=Rhodococcus opacus TaxID=37919 RepID=UPI00155AFE5F|nr:hypothetical protein [Rhodococcus opacus]
MNAEILDTPMGHWPPVTVHVRLSEPYEGHEYVAVSQLSMRGAERIEILPASQSGAYVSMTALWTGELATHRQALAALGYSTE